jgi:hypothetical protein
MGKTKSGSDEKGPLISKGKPPESNIEFAPILEKEKPTDPSMGIYSNMVEYAMVIVFVVFALWILGASYREAIVKAVQRIPAAVR